MSDQPQSWVRVCSVKEIPEGKAADLNISGQRLVIARCGETISIMQGSCSHMFFPLAGSKVENCVLTCALHRSTFDIRDGAVQEWSTFPPLVGKALALVREKKGLRTYQTRLQDGEVYVLWATTDPDSIKVKL